MSPYALLLPYLLVLLALPLLFIASLFYFFQRKAWQRNCGYAFGILLCLLTITELILKSNGQYSLNKNSCLLREAAGFLWIAVMLWLPAPGDETSTRKKLVVVLAIQLFFAVLTYWFGIYVVFSDEWEWSLLNSSLWLTLLMVGIILFCFQKPAGWYLLAAFFTYKITGSFAYLLWLMYIGLSQLVYTVELPLFWPVYMAYYVAVLSILFTKPLKSTQAGFRRRANLIMGLSALLSAAAFMYRHWR